MSIVSNSEHPLKVFLDRNIIVLSVIVEGAVRTQRIQLGSIEQDLEITGWRRKPLRSGDARWIAGEVACLPTIARLAIEGAVALFVSGEVSRESWKASPGARGIKGDIFATVPIEKVSDAVERSYFRPGSIGQMASRQEVIEYCRFLREVSPELLESTPELWERFPEEMQANIRQLGRFHDLIDALPAEQHWPDALHLWSAETHGADNFLTTDRKFVNMLTKTARIDLPTMPAYPSDLLREIGVKERDPLPIDDFEFHDYFEMIDAVKNTRAEKDDRHNDG